MIATWFTFDWQSLVANVVTVVLGWLLGSIGIGVPGVTPGRQFNKPKE